MAQHIRACALALLVGSVVDAAAACTDSVADRTAIAPKRAPSGRLHLSIARSGPQCREETFARATTASSYGINVNVLHQLAYYDSTPDASYRSIATLLREANVGWVRMDFSWGPIIAYDAYKSDTSQIDWSLMDADVDRAVCRGLNVLGILEYTPAWAVNRFNGPVFDLEPVSKPAAGGGTGPEYAARIGHGPALSHSAAAAVA